MTEDEFDAFYRGAVHRLTGQLYALTGNRDDAQDVVQEAFARAWDRRSRLADIDDPEQWVRTVAWRIGISRFRRAKTALAWRRKQRPPAAAPEPSPDHVVLVEALKRLPEAQRRAIVLHHLGDLPVADVAAETGQPVGTVKAQLSRGRAALAGLLAENAEMTTEPRHA